MGSVLIHIHRGKQQLHRRVTLEINFRFHQGVKQSNQHSSHPLVSLWFDPSYIQDSFFQHRCKQFRLTFFRFRFPGVSSIDNINNSLGTWEEERNKVLVNWSSMGNDAFSCCESLQAIQNSRDQTRLLSFFSGAPLCENDTATSQ